MSPLPGHPGGGGLGPQDKKKQPPFCGIRGKKRGQKARVTNWKELKPFQFRRLPRKYCEKKHQGLPQPQESKEEGFYSSKKTGKRTGEGDFCQKKRIIHESLAARGVYWLVFNFAEMAGIEGKKADCRERRETATFQNKEPFRRKKRKG